MRYALRLSAALLAVAVIACGGRRNQPRLPDPPTYLTVQNQSFSDMNIYALRSTQRIRLGMVTGNSTKQLTIPAYLIFGATSLRFLADPIGSQRTPISHEITVEPGDNIELIIPPGT